MSTAHVPAIVDSSDWFGPPVTPDALARLLLLDSDIVAVQLAYSHWDWMRPNNERQQSLPVGVWSETRLFYAKSFVTAVRRVERLANALTAGGRHFPPAVGERIRLAYRKKEALLGRYIEPRNAIEHIAGEIAPNVTWQLMNTVDNEFRVTDNAEHRVPITKETVDAILSMRAEMLAAVREATQ
jgi:hypothetical protein